MGGPACVADAGGAWQRLLFQHVGEVDELAAGAPPLDMAVHQGCDSGAVITAILQALKRLQQLGGGLVLADDAYYAAHFCVCPLEEERKDFFFEKKKQKTFATAHLRH
jgi:hypothetical protein